MQVIYLIAIIIFLPILAYAQGGLFINNSANVVANGSPQIIINDGKFVNDGDFSADGSTVFIKGTATTENSTIGGAAITTFNNLTISKSSNDTRLDFDIEVSGNLQMDGGLLILNYSDIELGGDILGETATNRITGTDGGAIIKTLDLNSPSGENPGNIGAEISSSANLGNTMIRRSHVQQVNGAATSIFRHYTFSPSNNFNLDATVRFHYFDEELAGKAENTLLLWEYNAPLWSSLGSESSNDIENWVEVTGIPSLDLLTLSEDMLPPLPIELLDFQAVANERKQVDLFWATATEIGNDYFTVERSRDGVQFEALREVDGAGNSSQTRYYQSIDENPFAGLSYYRLKQTDFDGTFAYSDIRAVNIESDEQRKFAVYPNPMNDVLHIVSDGTIKGKAIIEIYDAVGHSKYYQKLEMDEQLNSIAIDEVARFIAGNYFLVIRTSQDVYEFSLVKIGDE